jgi:phosphoribosylpyrophosphate synthetase
LEERNHRQSRCRRCQAVSLTYRYTRIKLIISATALADQLNLDFALINRKRKRDLPAFVPTVPPTPSGSDSGSVHEEEEGAIVEKMELLVGDVRGKVAILVDDMVDTGHTVRLAAGVLKDAGAKEVYALISHGRSNLVLVRYRADKQAC